MLDEFTDPITERILEATLEVLSNEGPRRLSLSAVAKVAGVSRPTLYRRFESKQQLLDAFGIYEQSKFDDGMAKAVSSLEGEDRLEAILRFIVEFQRSYSLRDIVPVEPEHVISQMERALPIMTSRLAPHFGGPDGPVIAAVVARVALSHALVPDPEPMDADRFLAELRWAAGLGSGRAHVLRGRRQARAPARSRRST